MAETAKLGVVQGGSALARALSKAQAKMSHASKDKTNPAFKSSYATLASVIEAVRGPLTENGFAFVQTPLSDVAAGRCGCLTELLHESGETKASEWWVPVAKADPQGYGSALTYARKYALQSICGIAPDEDDDGNAASVTHRNAPPAQTQHAPARAAPHSEDPAAVALRARALRLWKAAEAKKWPLEQFQSFASKLLGHKKPSSEWTEAELSQLEAALPAELHG